MKRRDRTRILIEGSRQLSGHFSRDIRRQHPVTELEAPRGALVMLKAREYGRGGLFYLGEVYVTSCKVAIGETIGLGIVKGHDEQLARDLAIIDAGCKLWLPELSDLDAELEAEDEKMNQAARRRQAKLLETMVEFETMEVDDGQ